MNTACVLIGNSDNKLSQADWSLFISEMQTTIASWGENIHFRGFAPGDAWWQNACWVFTIRVPTEIDKMKGAISLVGKTFNQDSVAFMAGNVEFI